MTKKIKNPIIPFKVGGKVEPPYFIGHDKELQILVNDAINLSQHNVIIAPRRYGKTSLLHNVKLKIEKNSHLLVIEINCREMNCIEDFYKNITENIIKTYAKKFKLKGLFINFQKVISDKITNAINALNEIGGSIKEVGEIYLKFREKTIHEKELLSATFNFIDMFSKEKNQSMLIILDEFQKLDSFNGLIYEFLKSKMDSNNNVKYFFSGSSLGLLDKVFLRQDSPLFLMSGKKYMTPLSEPTVIKFVKKRFKVIQIQLSDNNAKLFYDFTKGIPFYVQKLGLICYHHLLIEKGKSVSDAIIKRSFLEMLDEFDGEYEDRLATRFSDKQNQIIKAIAILEYASITAIAKKLKCKPTNISSTIKRLFQAMIIQKTTDGKYYLSDEVFRQWLVSQ